MLLHNNFDAYMWAHMFQRQRNCAVGATQYYDIYDTLYFNVCSNKEGGGKTYFYELLMALYFF